MAGLPLIGVALSAALIMVAALVVIRHWRRGNGQPLTSTSARGAAAGPASQPMAPHQTAIVPGFSETVPPDSGAQVPVPPGRATRPQARPAAPPQRDPRGPGPPPNGQRATAQAVTSDQIASYYDQADKPMADYLTALGWAHQPPHGPQPPGPAEHTKRHPPPSGGQKR